MGTFPYLGKCRGTPTTAGVTPAVCAGVTPAMTAGVTPAVVGVGPLQLQGSPLCFDPYKLQGSPLQSWGGPCTVGVDAVNVVVSTPVIGPLRSDLCDRTGLCTPTGLPTTMLTQSRPKPKRFSRAVYRCSSCRQSDSRAGWRAVTCSSAQGARARPGRPSDPPAPSAHRALVARPRRLRLAASSCSSG